MGTAYGCATVILGKGSELRCLQVICLTVGCLFAAPAIAEPMAWDCSVKNGGDWVTNRYLINYDPAQKEASVLDGVIYHFKSAFMPVTVKKDDGEVLSLEWIVRVKVHGKSGTIGYKVSVNQRSGAYSVSAIPRGYDNIGSGRGTCERVKAPVGLK